MKFKGTIIITDPCYIIRETNQITEDDWETCDYGRYMGALGINTYITESTIYGDWICTTYKVDDNPKEIIDNFAEAEENGRDYGVECSSLGDFCADTGLVAVFLLDEVRKYNPDIDKWIEENPGCVTTIEDFDGNVEYYIDKNSEAHIYGTGNINFFTYEYPKEFYN